MIYSHPLMCHTRNYSLDLTRIGCSCVPNSFYSLGTLPTSSNYYTVSIWSVLGFHIFNTISSGSTHFIAVLSITWVGIVQSFQGVNEYYESKTRVETKGRFTLWCLRWECRLLSPLGVSISAPVPLYVSMPPHSG